MGVVNLSRQKIRDLLLPSRQFCQHVLTALAILSVIGGENAPLLWPFQLYLLCASFSPFLTNTFCVRDCERRAPKAAFIKRPLVEAAPCKLPTSACKQLSSLTRAVSLSGRRRAHTQLASHFPFCETLWAKLTLFYTKQYLPLASVLLFLCALLGETELSFNI